MKDLLVTVIMTSVIICFVGCKNKFLNYPYAENNTSIDQHYKIEVKDDYKWMELDPSKNRIAEKWLKEERKLSDKYFKSKDLSVYKRIQELTNFERYVLIRSSSDTTYFAGLFPYSNKMNIYCFDESTQKSKLIKRFELPFQVEYKLNGLVINNGKQIALIGGTPGEPKSLYIYDLQNKSNKPVKTVSHVINFPLNPVEKGFLFKKDAFSEGDVYSGINSIYACYKKQDDSEKYHLKEVYTDDNFYSKYGFDNAFDESSKELYIGKYNSNKLDSYSLYKIYNNEGTTENMMEIAANPSENLRIAGADDINIYIVGLDQTLKGTLYTVNKATMKIDTVISNSTMDVKDFVLIKDHALIHFQSENENRAYLIEKNSLSITEFPTEDSSYYSFNQNKKSNILYFQRESLISPKEIYSVNTKQLTSPKRVHSNDKLPFNPDDYTIEYVTHISESGNPVNLQLTYKKGIKKDGSNPVFVTTFINAEQSFLDQFYLSRILYMDHGFIFVQRAKSDSKKTIVLENRIKDIYSSLKFLINEKYTSPDKIALFGREYGATAVMQVLNKYEDIKPVTILMDGIYDLVYYNEHGKLNYQNNKLFYANNTEKMRKIVDNSPYHNIKNKKNYPPILLMTSDENKLIPRHHTFKMTAKLQMRTRGYNPIIMLTPKRVDFLDEYPDYTYKVYIEHAFWFLTQNMGIEVEEINAG